MNIISMVFPTNITLLSNKSNSNPNTNSLLLYPIHSLAIFVLSVQWSILISSKHCSPFVTHSAFVCRAIASTSTSKIQKNLPGRWFSSLHFASRSPRQSAAISLVQDSQFHIGIRDYRFAWSYSVAISSCIGHVSRSCVNLELLNSSRLPVVCVGVCSCRAPRYKKLSDQIWMHFFSSLSLFFSLGLPLSLFSLRCGWCTSVEQSTIGLSGAHQLRQ